MIKKIDFQFEEGEIVYLKTDPYQYARVVKGYTLIGKLVQYILAIGEEQTAHTEHEISREINPEVIKNAE